VAQNSLSLPNPVYDYPVNGLVTVATELSSPWTGYCGDWAIQSMDCLLWRLSYPVYGLFTVATELSSPWTGYCGDWAIPAPYFEIIIYNSRRNREAAFSKGPVLSYVDEHQYSNFPFHLNSYMPFSGVYTRILNISIHCAELRTTFQNMSSIKCCNDQRRMKFLQCVFAMECFVYCKRLSTYSYPEMCGHVAWCDHIWHKRIEIMSSVTSLSI